MRERSFSAANRATSARAAVNARLARMIAKKPNIASDTSGSVISESHCTPVCHAGMSAGVTTATAVRNPTATRPQRPSAATHTTAT